jgi:hypothetical protein
VYGSLYSTLTWVSTQQLDEPCSYTRTDQGVQSRCRLPLGSLHANGALVQWGFGGRPGWSLGQMPGTPMRIGGRPAKLAVIETDTAANSCRQLDGDELLILWIARKVPHSDSFGSHGHKWSALSSALTVGLACVSRRGASRTTNRSEPGTHALGQRSGMSPERPIWGWDCLLFPPEGFAEHQEDKQCWEH